VNEKPGPAHPSCRFASELASTQVDALSAILLTCALTIGSGTRQSLQHVWKAETKFYGSIIIGARTGEKAKEKFAILELDLITVKGKTEPQNIYALLGREEIATGSDFQDLRKLWSTMLYCYRSRDWEGALEAIELCQSAKNIFGLTTLFNLYRTRIHAFRESAPPADWTGIFVAETK
jgi:adenylate cyclase